MSSENNNSRLPVSRRKLLGGLGTIGAASALGGAGTVAFFSDQETYPNNELVAGELDMVVDWEEHYSDWSEDENDDTEGDGNERPDGEEDDETFVAQRDSDDPLDFEVLMEDPEDPAWTGFPQVDPMVWIPPGYVDDFMRNTAIDAFPDGDNDALKNPQANPCDTLESLPEALSSNRRTNNAYTDPGDPLINLTDLKPGDFGEVTLSFALCDNPGYVWLNGNLIENAENGVNDPEGDDAQEDDPEGPNSGDSMSGELLSAIRTAFWYDDNCNNIVDRREGSVDIMIAVDRSGSINSTEWNDISGAVQDFVDRLKTTGVVGQIGQLTFGGDAIGDFQGLTDIGSFSLSLPGAAPPGSNNTPMPLALDVANAELDTNGTSDEQIVVLFSDGGPNYNSGEFSGGGYGDFTYDDGNGGGDVTADEQDETAEVAAGVRTGSRTDDGDGASSASPYDAPTRIITVGIGDPTDPDGAGPARQLDAFLENEIASSTDDHFEAGFDDLGAVAEAIALSVGSGEEVFLAGSLENTLLDDLSTGNGVALDGNPSSRERVCFDGGVDHCIGMAWWLPEDHANEIQSDSVKFDLGFYTEQCRHNTGEGMPGVTTKRGSGFLKLRQVENRNAGYGTGGENFDRPVAILGRGRNGDDNTWEVAIGDGDVPTEDTANRSWTFPVEDTEWDLTYNSSDGSTTFSVDGTTVSRTTAAGDFDGRLGITAKADEATVEVDGVMLNVDGTEYGLNGPSSVMASNDGSGRDIQYLVLNTDLDGTEDFTLSGRMSVDVQGDFPSDTDEGWAVDVSAE